MSVLGNIIWLICGGFFTGLGYIIGVTIVGTFGLWPPVYQVGCGHHDSVWDGDRPVARRRRGATAGTQSHLAGALWLAVGPLVKGDLCTLRAKTMIRSG